MPRAARDERTRESAITAMFGRFAAKRMELSSRSPNVTLADLIDLEAQLARDRETTSAVLAARDRGLLSDGDREGDRTADRRLLLTRWLAALREREPAALFPGGAVERAVRLARFTLVVLGVVLGWSAATGMVAFSGDHPVNVWDVLLVLVFAQLVLLLFLLVAFLFPIATMGAPSTGILREAVGGIVRRLARRLQGGRSAEWQVLWHRLRARRSLYHQIEPWLLLGTTQGFGVAFNVGALLALLRSVVFSDLAFGWSTTLVELDAARFQAMVSALAAPWGWFLPDGVPSLTLVEATRYSHLESAYLGARSGRAADPALVGGWWPFLAAAIACYGLVPRLTAYVLAQLRASRLLARLPLDDAEVARVLRRISEPAVDTRALAAERGHAVTSAVRSSRRPRIGSSGPAAVLLWRDTPRAVQSRVALHLGREISFVTGVGGRDDEVPGDLAAKLAGLDPIVMVVEGFEAPDRAALRLMRTIREEVGPRREIRVLVLDVQGDDARRASEMAVEVWRDGTAPLEDPFLTVETLSEASHE